MSKVKIAVFASGSGTNAERLIRYFRESDIADVSLVLCNNPQAYVIQRAKKLNVPSHIFNKASFYESDTVIQLLKQYKIDFIALAGFLWLVPEKLIRAYPQRILNIHPALLPKYGGKGMFGMNVHKSVIKNKESESGISIHLVNEHYDEGEILFQAKCSVEAEKMSPDELAEKIHALEHQHYPQVLDKYISSFEKQAK